MQRKKEITLFETPQSIKEHIRMLIDWMSTDLFEKQHIMAVALLSAIAGESIFLLGPPGTAKSMVARRLKMVFKEAKSFEYLMSRFSTPDEIFGPVSISKLKNEDKYERLVEGYLPDAEVVFLDEIWKAGPSIQNALLTALNERILKNGSVTIKLPMRALIAASNELPAEDEGLEALWDRFLIRIVSNCISEEKTFYKMVRSKIKENPAIPEELLIDEGMLLKWTKGAEEVLIPDEICKTVTYIRKTFAQWQKQEDIEPSDYYISDRRWKKIFQLMQSSAYLNNRKEINVTDCILLFHCLWNKSKDIPKVIETVCKAICSQIDKQIITISKAVEKTVAQIANRIPQNIVPANEKEDDYVVKNHFYYIVEGFIKGNCLFAKFDYNHVNIQGVTDGILYYNESNQQWVIHAIYTGAPFDYKKNTGKITKVKLRKIPGGIMIDGVLHLFRKKSGNNATIEDTNPTDSNMNEITMEYTSILKNFEQLKALFNDNENLFVSYNDLKLINNQLSESGKSLHQLGVKIQNINLLTTP